MVTESEKTVWIQRQLDLVLAIDEVRDALPEPSAMFAAIADVLIRHFQADLCILCLLERESGELELKIVVDRTGWFSQVEPLISRELVRRVAAAEGPVVWRGDALLSADVLAQVPRDVHIIATPITLGRNHRLGALLLARALLQFGPDEVKLLKIAEGQVDSAVVQGYAYYDLQQRNKELATVYKIDRIRDQHLPFDEMLTRVLYELSVVIQAEMGFVLLYDQMEQQLELRAATHDDLFRLSPYHEAVSRAANEALRRAEMVCQNDLPGEAGNGLRSILCVPLILNNEIIGVLGVANRYGPHGFGDAERRLLRAIGSQMDTAIFESLERRRLRNVLGRSVDPQVMEWLLKNPKVDFLAGERATLTVLYTDLRGSTSMSEATSPELLVGFINDYLGRMTEVILAHQGTIDKFLGDGVLALFGAPFPQPDHALRAVRVGLEMQVVHQDVMMAWRERGIDPAPMGVGIATGELTVGEMGSPQRTNYTVIGNAANLGSRICGVAMPGQVLICEETYRRIREHVEATPVTGLQLKGVSGEVTAYHVVGIRE